MSEWVSYWQFVSDKGRQLLKLGPIKSKDSQKVAYFTYFTYFTNLLILQQPLPPPLSILPGFQLGNSCDVRSLPQLVPFACFHVFFILFSFLSILLKRRPEPPKKNHKAKSFRAEFNTPHLHWWMYYKFCTIIANLGRNCEIGQIMAKHSKFGQSCA